MVLEQGEGPDGREQVIERIASLVSMVLVQSVDANHEHDAAEDEVAEEFWGHVCRREEWAQSDDVLYDL